MSFAVDDQEKTNRCRAQDLLPEPDGSLPARAEAHVRACPDCARTFEQWRKQAGLLRGLPRISARESGAEGLRTFAAARAAVESRDVTVLAREEQLLRPLLSRLRRHPAPARLRARVLASLVGSPRARLIRRRVVAAALAASLALLVTLTPRRGDGWTERLAEQGVAPRMRIVPVDLHSLDPQDPAGVLFRQRLRLFSPGSIGEGLR